MTTQITSLQEYKDLYAESISNPEAFWKKEAETFTWFKPFDKNVTEEEIQKRENKVKAAER